MVASKEIVAKKLAESHTRAESGIRDVYRLVSPTEQDEAEPIKLLEVNQDTVERGIEPIHFGPDPGNGITFAMVVVDVSPREFERIQSGQLSLPHGWTLGIRLSGGEG